MSEGRNCKKCGALLPVGVESRSCPACLMTLGLENWDEGSRSQGSTDTTPQQYPSGKADAPSVEALSPRFPQLEILELIGKGGMGAVYKARQKSLDRIVALKIINLDAAEDPSFAERFSREARSLARLTHPNIVTVYDFGEAPYMEGLHGDRPLYFFIMEYVDGANVRQLLQSGQLSPEQAMAIVPPLCDALQYAHDEGIVHRDIKPENILVDAKARVKVADFGLAKLIGRGPQDITLTAAHQAIGTLHYMAPEQMLSPLEVDHRADIFSLGVMFYEMLTGELPLGRFAPPSERVRIDVRLDEVVLRAMERQPERRYQHASDVKTDVDTITRQSGPLVREPNDTGYAACENEHDRSYGNIIGAGRDAGTYIAGLAKRLVELFPGACKAFLIVLYITGAFLFFSSSGSGGPRFSRVQYEIGSPMPWYEFEFAAGQQHGFDEPFEHCFRSQFHFLSPAWLSAATSFAALRLYNRQRLTSGEKVSWWDRPNTHVVVWLILAAILASFGHVAMYIHFTSLR